MPWRGGTPIHLNRRIPPQVRRFKSLGAARFRDEAATFMQVSGHATDPAALVSALREAQAQQRRAWLAYYRRLIITTGEEFAADGLPPKPKKEKRADDEPWGPAGNPWWVDTYRRRLGDEVWWDPWLRSMLRYAEHTAAARIRDVDQATRVMVGRVIRDGVADGLGVAAVRDNIHDLYVNGFTKVRAERIARTEVLNSARAGTYESTIAFGLADEATKSWQDSGDILVRPSHQEATALNQDIPYNADFQVPNPKTGVLESMRFPGDSSLGADAGNIINCRCDFFVNPTTKP